MIRIALDTSCLNAKKKHPVLNRIEVLDELCKIQLVTSTVNEKEQQNTNPSAGWRKKYLEEINKKEKVLETGRFGISSFDEFVFSCEEINAKLKKIIPEGYDSWLLETAIAAECDFFLTTNKKHFIDNGIMERLEKKLGIKIREPDQEFLDELTKILSDS